MKYLIYGANGWIGSMMCSLIEKENIEYLKGTVRVNETESLIEEIESIKPTHIMCFIGRTHGMYEGEKIGTIDYLEKPGKLVENIRDNLFSPLTLAILCSQRNIHLTYLGTGCIFTQEQDLIANSKGYTEESKPDFFGSSYSTVKGFTDQLMHLFDDNVLNLSNKKHTGTINLTNPGTISHNEILEMYKKYVDKDFTWSNFSIEEQSTVLLSARSNNKLNTATNSIINKCY